LCGVEQQEPEVIDENLEVAKDEGYITAEIRLILASSCCGDEIAEANLTIEEHVDLEHEHDTKKFGTLNFELELTAENVDRFEGKGRYAKHFYGADITATVTCTCGWKTSIDTAVEEQASSFDSLV
jgi:hypothetical protein